MSINTHSATFVAASTQSLLVADTVPLSITGSMTIECWVKMTTQPAGDFVMVSKWESTGNQRSYLISYHNDGANNFFLQASLSSDGSADSANQISQTLNNATWYHVAMVFTAGSTQIEFFVNGVSIGTQSSVGSIFNSTAELEIGSRDGTSGSFTDCMNGKIDDVRIWNTTRSGAQILANMNVELAGTETGLVGYWKLNNALTDSTSNAATLTNHNTATFTSDIPFIGSIEISDTSAITDSVSLAVTQSGTASVTYSASNITILATETMGLSDRATAKIGWGNQSKNSSSWTNVSKS